MLLPPLSRAYELLKRQKEEEDARREEEKALLDLLRAEVHAVVALPCLNTLQNAWEEFIGEEACRGPAWVQLHRAIRI